MKIAFIGMETSGMMRRQFQRLGYFAISCDRLKPQDTVETLYLVGLFHSLVPRAFGAVHLVGDVFEAVNYLYGCGIALDVAVFHPDCTYLTNSAAWAFNDPDYTRYPGVGYHQKVKPETLVGADRVKARAEAVDVALRLRTLKVRRLAIENPIGHLSSQIGPPTQVVQPYQFGDDASKGTCLWIYESGDLCGKDRAIPINPRQRLPGRMAEWPKGSGKMVERWSNQTDSGQNRLTPSEDRWATRADTYPGIAKALAEHLDHGMNQYPRRLI